MDFDLVVKGGDVVADGTIRRADVGVKDGRIAAVSEEPLGGAETFDARGLHVYPGGVDTHCHFRDPGRTDKEDFVSGTRAAACGGITTVLDIQNNEPFTVDRVRAAEKLAVVAPKARVNFGVYGSVGMQNLERLRDLAPLVCAYKVFMTQSVGSLTVVDVGELLDVFRTVRDLGRVLAVHAEADGINRRAKEGLPDAPSSHVKARPPVAEAVAVAECVELCRATRTPLNLPHLSTARSVELVRRAKEDGLPISAATCPHYLYFDADDVERGGNVFKVNPSIKYAEDREALLDGVRDGVIDHVHSDHAPHTPEEKARSYAAAPSGIAGLQHQFPVMLELVARGRLAPPDVARLLCEAPAKAFGLRDVGRVAKGFRADLAVVDPSRVCTPTQDRLLSKAASSPYLARALRGSVVATLLGGRIVWRDGVEVDPDARGERLQPSL
ncbi:MAG TPA: dihydroorotase family protein [Planctomycetota bacterium]|nr:dihydroorotase family protein [Planctomycetota bacterium]